MPAATPNAKSIYCPVCSERKRTGHGIWKRLQEDTLLVRRNDTDKNGIPMLTIAPADTWVCAGHIAIPIDPLLGLLNLYLQELEEPKTEEPPGDNLLSSPDGRLQVPEASEPEA